MCPKLACSAVVRRLERAAKAREAMTVCAHAAGDSAPVDRISYATARRLTRALRRQAGPRKWNSRHPVARRPSDGRPCADRTAAEFLRQAMPAGRDTVSPHALRRLPRVGDHRLPLRLPGGDTGHEIFRTTRHLEVTDVADLTHHRLRPETAHDSKRRLVDEVAARTCRCREIPSERRIEVGIALLGHGRDVGGGEPVPVRTHRQGAQRS